MNIQIREADAEDIDLLVEWRMRTLHEVFPAPDYCITEDLEQASRDYYLTSIPAGTHIACFAMSDGEIVGCGGICLHQEMPSPDNENGRCAYLMNIYCDAAARGQGVGTALVTYLVDQAISRQASKIYLETTPEGRRLYEQMGFVDMEDMMILPPSAARSS